MLCIQEQERLTMDRMNLETTLRDMQTQMEHARKVGPVFIVLNP